MKPYMTDAQKIKNEIVRLEERSIETFIEILKLQSWIESARTRNEDTTELEKRLRELEKTYEALRKEIDKKYRELLKL